MSKNRLVAGAPEIDADKTIAELFHAIEELMSRRKRPKELAGLIDEAKTLVNEWKDPRSAKHPKHRRPLFDGTSTDTNFLLAALVVVLRRDHEVLKRIRRHCPNDFKNLTYASEMAELREIASVLLPPSAKPTAKQKYDRKRRRSYRSFYNSIEYQFGGEAEAERWKPLSAVYGLPYEPTCLDGIFAWETVNMQSLEDLFFGIERHLLGKILRDIQKRQYDYVAVAKIMHFLLKEEPQIKRKRASSGRPRRKPWLNNRDLRVRVLKAIKARITGIAAALGESNPDIAQRWQTEIADVFLAVVRCHLRDSGKK
jgi:hypothetical protein